MKRILAKLIILWFSLNQYLFSQTIYPSSYDHKVVIVPQGQSRTFMFTNRTGLFYYGETGLPNTSHYNGLGYLTHEFLDDYVIEIGGVELSRSQAEVHLMGDKLVRQFKKPSIEEEVSMADTLPILLIKICTKQKTPMAIAPMISGSTEKQDYTVDWSSSDKILFIAPKHQLASKEENGCPKWLGIFSYPQGEFTISGNENQVKYSKSVSVKEKLFCPGKINIFLESEAVIMFIIGGNKSTMLRSRNLMLKELNIEIERNNSQVEGVRQAQSYLVFPPFHKAFTPMHPYSNIALFQYPINPSVSIKIPASFFLSMEGHIISALISI